MIFLAGSDYFIKENSVVLITSCMHANSSFSSEERYKQTMESINSIRQYLPESKIVLIEMSKLKDEWKNNINELCDYMIDCSLHSEIQKINECKVKSAGESALLKEALSHIDTNILYKLSGRYMLYKTPNFVKDKINFKANIERSVYHTTLYFVPRNHFTYMIDVVTLSQEKILQLYNLGYWYDIEHCFFDFIDIEKVNIIEDIGVLGYESSGNFYKA